MISEIFKPLINVTRFRDAMRDTRGAGARPKFQTQGFHFSQAQGWMKGRPIGKTAPILS
jgi:hypothetical protein